MSNETRPLVSVVMATYNDDPAFLDAAIRSVEEQSYTEWELVIVDDSTRPESCAVLERHAAKLGIKLIYEHNKTRLGLVASINRGLELAQGSLIARMDGDDLCLPERLEVQVGHLRAHPEVGILGGQIQIIAEDGSPLAVRRYKASHEQVEKMSFIRNPLAQPAVMLRRAVLDAIGVYDPTFKKSEDYELWLRALRRGVRIENLERVLIQYRVRRDYHVKRDKDNWHFAVKAKLKNFNSRRPLRSALGICMSLGLGLMPPRLLNRLYARDHESPILYG